MSLWIEERWRIWEISRKTNIVINGRNDGGLDWRSKKREIKIFEGYFKNKKS